MSKRSLQEDGSDDDDQVRIEPKAKKPRLIDAPDLRKKKEEETKPNPGPDPTNVDLVMFFQNAMDEGNVSTFRPSTTKHAKTILDVFAADDDTFLPTLSYILDYFMDEEKPTEYKKYYDVPSAIRALTLEELGEWNILENEEAVYECHGKLKVYITPRDW